MERLVKAFQNSVRAFGRLISSERAFQQEVVLLLVALPVAWFLAESWRGFALLIGSLLLLILVEIINTAIEATCDAISREFNGNIQLAKDCGSLAVLIAIVIALGVWGIAVAERLLGLPV